jgi:hypothetical protein
MAIKGTKVEAHAGNKKQKNQFHCATLQDCAHGTRALKDTRLPASVAAGALRKQRRIAMLVNPLSD